ncbi:acetoacetate decarboxylase family protein [Nocardioides xinjiangensis]|uniref:acetoacetate decarboxylase family protein n=1 Tax=Nocardioides xinjiangensis TaxID=2817376 RepID=UPI001B31891B|nr:acetoacetate decarboxylase family protein [Nocardioides sp. SYSU D00778]
MYPPAPWRLHGQLWLSLFGVGRGGAPGRPPGVCAVALVRYEAPGVLTYDELLVSRPVARPVRGVTVDQIWVDSAASMLGGRELWAIPKELAAFDAGVRRSRLVDRAAWRVTHQGAPVLQARFEDASRFAPRLPFRGTVWQPGLVGEPGLDGPRSARLSGSARALPCRGRWHFAGDGPLGWLAGHRPWLSVRLTDFALEVGGAS